MKDIDKAREEARFYKQALVQVTHYDGTVDYYATSYPVKSNYVPEGFSGDMVVIVDYRVKQDFRVQGSIVKYLMVLTKTEVTNILIDRGYQATGYPVHTYGNKYYYWPMGRQPSEEVKTKIISKNPTKAANKFLAIYKRFETGTQFTQPTKIQGA